MPDIPGFIGPTYQSQNPNVDAERCLNLYPELIESGRGPTPSRYAYYNTPGVALFASLGASIRAIWGGNNEIFVLAGASVYQYSTTGALIQTYAVANPSGAGPGQIVFVPSGPGLTLASSGAVLVWDGSPGFAGGSTYPNVWYLDGTTTTPPAVISGRGLGCIDGYAVVLRPGCTAAAGAADPIPINTIDQTQYNLSPIFQAGPGIWDPLQFAIKTGAPDALQTIWTPGSLFGGGPEELWLIGQQSTEVWYDTGGSSLDPFPFQRVPGAFISTGAWAAASVANVNGQLVWLAGDARGVGTVVAMNGYTPQRVSNHAIEYAIQQAQIAGVQVSSATAYSYQENGHAFYVLTIGNRTFAADFSCMDSSGRPMWHERARGSTLGGLSPSWSFHAWAGGQHFVAGGNDGNVYVSSVGTYQDNGDARLRCRVGPVVSQDQQWHREGQFSLSVGGPWASLSGRTYNVDWSNDGGNTYGTQFPLSPQQNLTTGFWRIFKNKLGRTRGRNYRVQTTDNAPDAWIDASVGVG